MKKLLTILFATILTGTTFGQTENDRFQFLIEQCSSINSENYKCSPYILLAGYIQSLDRTKAIEILKEYAGTNKYEDQIIILTRLLFQGKKNAVLRRPLIGAAGFIGNTGYKDWPSEPIEISNGIPFLITRGYSLGGKAESSLKYLEYCIANGQWTNNNYRIIKSEELKPALNTLLNSKKWQKELTRSEKAFFEEQIDTTSEHLIYQGRLVEIFVEKAIYHSPTNDNFLMRFLIKNISAKLIGVDLTDFRKTIYPNQWGIYTKPYREVVDERAYAPDTMINQAELLKKFKDNSLTIMPPNETLEYYRDWNGGAEKVELKNREDYLIISVAGQLLFTNGADFEDARLLTAAEKNRAVVFDYPINNKTIPEKSLIIGSN